MAHIERMQTECPPDAHKVIRPPENAVNATLVVRVDPAEAEKYGIEDFCEVLSLMSAKPLILCEDEALKAKIEAQKAAAEIEPVYLKLFKDSKDACLTYADGAQGQALPYTDISESPEQAKSFFEELGKKQFIIIADMPMLILRSISTVFPWDTLLAGDFLRQYEKATAALKPGDRETLLDVRYGRVDGFSFKESNPEVYQYVRLERKLFLQYPTDDDD